MLYIAVQFLALAAVVVGGGVLVTRAADEIAEITGLGRLLIGSVLVAAATSLPELTVDLSAVRMGFVDLAFGDLIGSSLMNLLILALLDLLHRAGGKMLSHEAAAHALSATLSIALTALAGLAVLTASRLSVVSPLGVDLWGWAILGAYVLGARMIFVDQRIAARLAEEAVPSSEIHSRSEHARRARLTKPVLMFIAGAVVLCLAGPRLARVAGQLADLSGLGKTFVGTTLVAFSTSLPELVASITALRMRAFDLVIGNIFGSNAFNMIMVVPLDAVHPGSLFADVAPVHAVTAMAVIVATAIAVLGQLYRIERRLRLIEPDAMLVVIVLFTALAIVYQMSV